MPDAGQATPWLNFLLGPFGLTVGLIGFVWALYTERIVPGTTHKRVALERDKALARAERALHITGRAIEVAEPKKE